MSNLAFKLRNPEALCVNPGLTVVVALTAGG
jgi:hypothetical protein